MVHLLIINDESAILPDMVRYAFLAPRNRVEVAHSGWEGLNCIVAKLPDVILLNLRLSDQAGLEVLRQIRAMDARVPVVFVTGSRSADSGIEAIRQGAYDYLSKPLDLKELEQVIGAAVKVAKLMREPAIEARMNWTLGRLTSKMLRASRSWDAVQVCGESARPSAASPTRRSRCLSPAKAAPARSWLPEPYIGTAQGQSAFLGAELRGHTGAVVGK